MKMTPVKWLNICYAVLIFIACMALIGRTSNNCFEPFSFGDAMSAFSMLFVAWILGYWLGKGG